MKMTIDYCIEMLIAKQTCIEREISGIHTNCNIHNCENCSLCYEQGNMGEQIEVLKLAVDTMRKYQKLKKAMKDIQEKIENTMKYQYAVGENEYAEGFEKSLEIIDNHKAESEG